MLARLRAALSGSASGGSSSSARRRSSTVTAADAAANNAARPTPATPPPPPPGLRSLAVAVVGGGAGGLAAARELLKEGHRPTVFEQNDSIGGVWVYNECAVDALPLGVGVGVGDGDGDGDQTSAPPPPSSAPNATDRQAPPLPWTQAVHGSIYRQLRTNLPREVMGYLDFPFSADFAEQQQQAGGGGGNGNSSNGSSSSNSSSSSGDPRRYPGHAEVLAYLEAYADAFGLRPHFRLGTRVVRATPLSEEQEEEEEEDGGGAAHDAAAATAEALPGPRWRVESVAVERDAQTGRLRPSAAAAAAGPSSSSPRCETFDALVVANGHYALPNLPAVAVSRAARRLFPGAQLHSHNYRSPGPYRGRRVVVVGASNSGGDLADEIAAAGAELVVLSARGWSKSGGGAAAASPAANLPHDRPNVRRRGMLCDLRADGACAFDDDADDLVPNVDAIIYATGYRYAFDFLDEAFPHGASEEGEGEGEEEGARTSGGAADPAAAAPPPPLLRWRDEPGRVAPLYLHMFPARGRLAPRLSFLGLPWKVVPFPLMQAQARLVARLLSGRAPAPLPSEPEMLAAVAAEGAARRARGAPERHAHVLGGEQWAYNAELLRLCGDGVDGGEGDKEGEAPVPGSWRARMYSAAGENKRAPHPGGPSAYRDRWEGAEAEGTALEAAAEFEALWRARKGGGRGGRGRGGGDGRARVVITETGSRGN
jgi:cation diffusion facilitator CzcD-associated flavoprotein CzcO